MANTRQRKGIKPQSMGKALHANNKYSCRWEEQDPLIQTFKGITDIALKTASNTPNGYDEEANTYIYPPHDPGKGTKKNS